MHWTEAEMLTEILDRIKRIERILLEKKPQFVLKIDQRLCLGKQFSLYKGEQMSIQQGSTGVFRGTVTASDGSEVTTSKWSWSASDPAVTIANDPSDSTGAIVDVTVPASDTNTTFNLTASATATSPTESTPQSVTDTVSVTVTTGPQVTFTLSIAQTK